MVILPGSVFNFLLKDRIWPTLEQFFLFEKPILGKSFVVLSSKQESQKLFPMVKWQCLLKTHVGLNFSG